MLYLARKVIRMAQREFKSFTEFWPHYVVEHSRPATRLFHFVGTFAGIACLILFIARGRWLLVPLAFVPGYAAAWFGHFFIERNRPATFQHPVWSFLADYKMIALMMTGKMQREVARQIDAETASNTL